MEWSVREEDYIRMSKEEGKQKIRKQVKRRSRDGDGSRSRVVRMIKGHVRDQGHVRSGDRSTWYMSRDI